MKSKKVLSLLLACAVTVSMGTTVFASTEDQIAAAQAQKQEAQAGLAQAQANISGLESKKQELESYLAELNSQYNELTDSISQLSIEAAEKEEELKNVKAQLEVAKQNAQDQYEAMKIRIQYMYEHGGSTMLEMLLSSDNLSDFMNQANNVATISTYDRNMLKKYEETQEAIKTQETQVEEESASIGNLLTEKSSKQQEVQNLVASTSDNINSYVNQISASQEEADALMAQVNSADSSISQLMEEAEQEKAAEAAAADAARCTQRSPRTAGTRRGYRPRGPCAGHRGAKRGRACGKEKHQTDADPVRPRGRAGSGAACGGRRPRRPGYRTDEPQLFKVDGRSRRRWRRDITRSCRNGQERMSRPGPARRSFRGGWV